MFTIGNRTICLSLLCILLTALFLTGGCTDTDGRKQAPVSAEIDWVDFIQWNGTQYLSKINDSTAEIAESLVGNEIGVVKVRAADSEFDPESPLKDGAAAFLAKGTKLYEVKGYSPGFRITAENDGKWKLYEADTVPDAKAGSDLLDLRDKVEDIEIIGGKDGQTQLGVIRNAAIALKLVNMVLSSPVKTESKAVSKKEVFVRFYFKDGTFTQRKLGIDSGLLGRGIQLPSEFGVEIQAVISNSGPDATASVDSNADDIRQAAEKALTALQKLDLDTLADMTHPDKGILFSPYSYIDTEHSMIFTANQMKTLFTDERTYTWGSYDGSGEPIELTPAQYWRTFIVDRDYSKAPEIAVNKTIGKGNMSNNLKDVYPNNPFIEYHYPGFDKKLEGHDWVSLRLVFEKLNDRLYLVAVIHDQWTI